MMTRQQRFHLQTCHEDDLIDLNQKATRIKDLLFGPQGKIYLLMLRLQCVLYASVCVYYLQLRASKVFFGNFLKVVSPPPLSFRANSFLSRMSKLQPFSFKLFSIKYAFPSKHTTLLEQSEFCHEYGSKIEYATCVRQNRN